MSILYKIKNLLINFLEDNRIQCKAKIFYIDQTYYCTKRKDHWGPHISYKGRPFYF